MDDERWRQTASPGASNSPVLDDAGLRPAFRLYAHIKRVAGDDKTCPGHPHDGPTCAACRSAR